MEAQTSNERVARNGRIVRLERRQSSGVRGLLASGGWRKRLGVEPAADNDSRGLTAFSNSADPRISVLCRREPPDCPQRKTRLTGFEPRTQSADRAVPGWDVVVPENTHSRRERDGAIMDARGQTMSPHLSIDREAVSACCPRHHFARLALSGSVQRDDVGADSDVDVLVEFLPGLVGGLAPSRFPRGNRRHPRQGSVSKHLPFRSWARGATCSLRTAPGAARLPIVEAGSPSRQ